VLRTGNVRHEIGYTIDHSGLWKDFREWLQRQGLSDIGAWYAQIQTSIGWPWPE
jgi:hypothetical protein